MQISLASPFAVMAAGQYYLLRIDRANWNFTIERELIPESRVSFAQLSIDPPARLNGDSLLAMRARILATEACIRHTGGRFTLEPVPPTRGNGWRTVGHILDSLSHSDTVRLRAVRCVEHDARQHR